jgi:hypothetical protein
LSCDAALHGADGVQNPEWDKDQAIFAVQPIARSSTSKGAVDYRLSRASCVMHLFIDFCCFLEPEHLHEQWNQPHTYNHFSSHDLTT